MEQDLVTELRDLAQRLTVFFGHKGPGNTHYDAIKLLNTAADTIETFTKKDK